MRTRMTALAFLALSAAAGFLAFRWPRPQAKMECEHYEIDAAGVLRCGTGALAPGQAASAGIRFDLNSASMQDLQQVPGLGQSVATALVTARPDGGFRNWEEVDAVPGLGPARLELLRRLSSLNYSDAGL
jgi:competence protein ComEA